MPRRSTLFVCTACGHEEAKWLGQCPACNEWNTLEERNVSPGHGNSRRTVADTPRSRMLSEIPAEVEGRIRTGMGELDRALGGGLMPGSTVLIGGEPGIGKSTLMLQAAAAVAAQQGPVLYVSGEESAPQIRQRADRLGCATQPVHLLSSASLSVLLNEMDRLQPRLVVVDSIQTITAADAGSVPGTVNQIKYVTHELAEWSREHRAAVMTVAHVTKEGQIAGPRVVEHMVDAVLLFEHSGGDLRFLRALKNRFGAIEEVGIFTMESRGLVEVTDPGGVFLRQDREHTPPGVVAAPCFEGSRVLLVEIQALTVPAKGAVSRTFSDRIDNRRVSRVAAVLEKHGGLRFADHDLYVNVAGGIRIQDVAIDLPLALALFSARQGVSTIPGTVATGELTLAGEVRPVSHQSQRHRAATEMGFRHVVGPGGNKHDPSGWVTANSIPEAIARCFSR